jgi:anti-sigma regulatory factor (Ser/Thr protein kinase)
LTLTTPANQLPLSESPNVVSIPGGKGAAAIARRHVRSQLDGNVPALRKADAALIVTELVTNSVIHANVGIDQSLCLELTSFEDHLRIAVTDPGSQLEPHLRPADPAALGGLGLRLVDQLCSVWGVTRDAAGITCVWCDLPLDRARFS